jgi:hypothetical protein
VLKVIKNINSLNYVAIYLEYLYLKSFKNLLTFRLNLSFSIFSFKIVFSSESEESKTLVGDVFGYKLLKLCIDAINIPFSFNYDLNNSFIHYFGILPR